MPVSDASLAVERSKLEWAARLSAVLLNDATDAVRWFLMEHSPFMGNRIATLTEVLEENRPLLSALRDGTDTRKFINNEVFDILYRPDGKEVDPADLELSVLFILIRFLCKIKHPSWKYWDEEPGNHQVLPLFDVIRLVRFKDRMKGIVHSYEVTQQSFAASWRYITTVLDRLRCYQISTRRWIDDVIADREPPEVEGMFRKFVDVMRWQTTELWERDKVYQNLKESRVLKLRENKKGLETWDQFLSRFGQHRNLKLSALNKPKDSYQPTVDEKGISKSSIKWSSALEINSKHREAAKVDRAKKFGQKNKRGPVKNSIEPQLKYYDDLLVLDRIDNRVYIHEQEDLDSTQTLRRALKSLYISKRGKIIPLPTNPSYIIPMDRTVINVSRLDESDDVVLRVSDVTEARPAMVPLESWREMLDFSTYKRKIVFGSWSSGKSVLLHKIAYDWGTQNHLTLSSHRFVFSLDLELVRLERPYTRLSDVILEQCVLSNGIEELNTVTSDNIESLFASSNGSGILLLLDNFDRMASIDNEQLSEIYDVINGYIWPDCCIVMTSSHLPREAREEKGARNFLALNNRAILWEYFATNGFKQHDVIMHSKHYIYQMLETENVSDYIDFLRVYQRDVCHGIMTSPVMTYVLCDAWGAVLQRSGKAVSCPSMETLHDVLKISTRRFLPCLSKNHDPNNASFSREVLCRKVRGEFCSVFDCEVFDCNVIKVMVEHGIVKSYKCVDRNSQHPKHFVKFSHVFFEDLCAARAAVDGEVLSRQKLLSLLQEDVTTLLKANKLRYFFQLCCASSGDIVKLLVQFLTDLLHTQCRRLTPSDLRDTSLFESIKLVIFQCFYEAKSSHEDVAKILSSAKENFTSLEVEYPIRNLIKNFNDDHRWPERFRGHHYRQDGSSLRFKYAECFSNKSLQAILFHADRCRPHLTPSGSVRANMTSSQYWLRHLCLTGLQGQNMHFVALVLGKLPFLEELYLPNAKHVCNDHVSALCRGFDSKPLNLHALLFTLDTLTSKFNIGDVATYAEVGRALTNLPHLEYLYLSINNEPDLFFSLFEDRSTCVVPLTELKLSSCGVDTQQCARLTPLLKRLIFLQRLDLSRNPLENGFAEICEGFHYFRDLQILTLQQTCLRRKSMLRLSVAISHTNLAHSLRHLDVRENYLQDEEAMKILAESLKSLVALEYFDVSHNYVGDRNACIMARAFQGHSRLCCLRMTCVQIGEVALSALKYHLRDCAALEILDLGENYFGSACLDFAQVFKSFEEFNKATPVLAGKTTNACGLTALRDLDLSGIGESMVTECSPSSVTSFIECIGVQGKLRHLTLRDVKLDFDSLVVLLDACESLSSMQSVIFSRSCNSLSEKQSQNWACLNLV